VVQADAENLPFKIGEFDIVTLCQVIEHIEYPQDILEKILSILRPGGILHVDTPAPHNIFSRITNYRIASSFGFGHVTLFTKDSLTRILVSSGYEVDNIQGYMNSFHLAGVLIYGLLGLRKRKAWSSSAATALVSARAYKTLQENHPVQYIKRRSNFSNLLREGVVLANWALRICIGYAIAPIWNPIARSLSHRPVGLALMEVQARRPFKNFPKIK